MTRCPNQERLIVFAAGGCAADESNSLADHIHRCPACRAFIERERSNSDWLGGVRGAPAADATQVVGTSAGSAVASASAPQAEEAAATPPLPAVAGYRVRQLLDAGGQAAIYLATQESTGQEVAVKVPREGHYITKAERRRFEREIELVAQLKHPAIISIFDSGLTGDGRRFYVMDYVAGQHLHAHVRERQLPLEQTVALFVKVCEAVQFAHQHGVIHRDLKPANIIVDESGTPRVLDFGLARAIAAPPDTLVSVANEVVGTLAYMSPEQASGDPTAVDTGTDVYALGVILYQLLTGGLPFDVSGGVAHALRAICTADPVPPVRQWQPGAGVPPRRRLRGSGCPIDDDLQTIVLKAIAKERDRRYASARDLAADLQRYLAGEPIEAKRDSGWYILRKTLRRYRSTVAVTAAILLTVTGALLITWGQVREKSQALTTVDELLADGVEKVQEAKLDEALRSLHTYQRLAASGMAGEALGRLSAALVDVRQAVREKVELALSANRVGPLVQALLSDPELREVFAGLSEPADADDLPSRLARHLEAGLTWPRPAGRGQQLLDNCRLIKILDPQRRRPSVFLQHLTGQAPGTYDPVYSEDFESHEPGRPPPGWEQEGPLSEVVADGGSKVYRVWSEAEPTYAPAAYHMLPDELDSPYVALSFALRFVPGERQPGAQVSYATVMLDLGGATALARFLPPGAAKPQEALARYEIPLGDPRVMMDPDGWVSVHALVDGEAGKVDWIVGEGLLIEDVDLARRDAASVLHLGTFGGIAAEFDDLVLRCGPALGKLDGGGSPVLVPARGDSEELPLVRRFAADACSVVLYDLDEDGGSELVTTRVGNRSALDVYAFSGRLCEPRHLGTAELPGVSHLVVNDVAGRYLGLSRTGRAQGADKGDVGLSLATLDQDLTLREVFSWRYEDLKQTRAPIATVRAGGGQRGFVVGTGHHARAFEFFLATPGDSDAAFKRLGKHEVTGSDFTTWVDIVDLEVGDRDGDGVDDCVLLALGPAASGNRPALVTMSQGLPDPGSEPRVRALTDYAVGETRVAVSCLGTERPHLIAGSRELGASSPDLAGVRVWPVDAIDPDAMPEPIRPAEDPQDVRALVAGVVAGREVFAVASVDFVEGLPCKRVHVRVYGLDDDGLEVLWEAVLYDVPAEAEPRTLLLGDVNGDGRSELILSLTNGRFVVFAVES